MTSSVKSASGLAMTERIAGLRLQIEMADLSERLRFNIKRRRQELGLNQRQLAERMSAAVSNQHVSNWERGIHQPSKRYVEELADALDTDPAYFMQPLPEETPDLVETLQPNGRSQEERLTDMEAKLDEVIRLVAVLADDETDQAEEQATRPAEEEDERPEQTPDEGEEDAPGSAQADPR